MHSNPASDLPSSPANHNVQGYLFAPSHLPRQLPIYKHGPEDDSLLKRTPKPTQH